MSKRGLLLLAISTMTLCLALAETTLAKTAPPASFKLLRIQKGKPPLMFYHCKVTFRNPYNRPTWLLLADDIGYSFFPREKRAKHLRIPSRPVGETVFEGKRYKGNKGPVISVHAFLKPTLKILYLPPKGVITFEEYPFETWGKTNKVDILLASDVLVNGKKSLNKWLPFATKSKSGTIVPADNKWHNLNWDKKRNKERTDFPKEVVKFLELIDLRSHKVKINR